MKPSYLDTDHLKMHICSPRATIKTILKGFAKKLIEVKWTTKKYSTNTKNSKAGMKH